MTNSDGVQTKVTSPVTVEFKNSEKVIHIEFEKVDGIYQRFYFEAEVLVHRDFDGNILEITIKPKLPEDFDVIFSDVFR